MRIRGEARADDLDAGEATAQEERPSREKGAKDDLAELGKRIDGIAQRLRVELEHAAGAADACRDERHTAGERVDVAGELVRPVHRDHARLSVRVLDDLNLAVEDDVEAEVAIALGEEDLVRGDLALASPGTERVDLTLDQRGEGDVVLRRAAPNGDGHLRHSGK